MYVRVGNRDEKNDTIAGCAFMHSSEILKSNIARDARYGEMYMKYSKYSAASKTILSVNFLSLVSKTTFDM